MDSARRTAALPAVGFPIRTSPDQSLVSGSPKLIAATRVLHRLLSPRHPSCALGSLVIVSSRSRIAVAILHEDQGPARWLLRRVDDAKAPSHISAYSSLASMQCSKTDWSWCSLSRSDRRQPASTAG